jgi:hypothetical protein
MRSVNEHGDIMNGLYYDKCHRILTTKEIMRIHPTLIESKNVEQEKYRGTTSITPKVKTSKAEMSKIRVDDVLYRPSRTSDSMTGCSE